MLAKYLTSRFITSTRGTAGIEFGIVALPFFALMFAIIEVSLIYFGNVTLENGMNEAARLVRTGQLQASGGTIDDFKDAICENTFPLFAEVP